MDNYKFGNLLCSLRESHNLTQRQLAQMLDVSDKAVSKWENGQAIPRMDTLEKIASVLETTVEDLIIACKDNVKRILIVNNYGTLLHIELEDRVISLKTGDEQYIELDEGVDFIDMAVSGELKMADIIDECEYDKNSIKERLKNKGIKQIAKVVDKVIDSSVIRTKCYYRLSNLKNEQELSIEYEVFSIGDKMWTGTDICISYPKIIGDLNSKIRNAVCINRAESLSGFRTVALTSELGISIPFMLLAYPFRKMYFKSVLSSKGLMKYLSKADYYMAKDNKRTEKRKKRKHPVLKTIGIILLFIIAWFGIDIVGGIMNVETDKPVLVSADYSTVYYYNDEYVRIDNLPYDAVPNKSFGVEVWHDARIEGKSKSDQFFDENKVTEFKDNEGNIYLWFVPDYIDSITDENGEYKELKDFENPYLYTLKSK